MENETFIREAMTITYKFLAYFVRAGMLKIEEAIYVMEVSSQNDIYIWGKLFFC